MADPMVKNLLKHLLMAMDEVGVDEALQDEIAANFKKHIPMVIGEDAEDVEMGMEEDSGYGAFLDDTNVVDEKKEEELY